MTDGLLIVRLNGTRDHTFFWGRDLFIRYPPPRITTNRVPHIPSLATRRIYTCMCALPQWHGATQTCFSPRLRKHHCTATSPFNIYS